MTVIPSLVCITKQRFYGNMQKWTNSFVLCLKFLVLLPCVELFIPTLFSIMTFQQRKYIKITNIRE